MMSYRSGLLFVLALCPVMSACAADAPATGDEAAPIAAAPAPRELTIRSIDYQFVDMPDTVEAGLTNIQLINDGPELHHVYMVRLEDGHTLSDLMEVFAAGGPPPSWAVDVGGPNSPGTPGGATAAVLDLAPGNYAVLCVIPSPDGVPHIMKGMVHELTVVPGSGPAPVLPAADVVMTLDDYSFTMSTPITAGARTIRVENAAVQAHEVLIVKLEEGRTAEDMLQWVHKPEGAPPGMILGGTTGFAQGGMNQITMTFEPGDYALLCFVPDAGDGRPHFMHGMVQQIEVM